MIGVPVAVCCNSPFSKCSEKSSASLSTSAAVSPSWMYGLRYDVSGSEKIQKKRLHPIRIVVSLKNHLHPRSAIKYPAIHGPTWEPAARNREKKAIAVAKYRSRNKSPMMLGPRDSQLPAPRLARIRAPRRPLILVALKDQMEPAKKTRRESRMQGRLPMHMARGIQKRFETPSAKTDQEMRFVRGPVPTRNSIARASKPVVIPA
jgi:hypothetical protein